MTKVQRIALLVGVAGIPIVYYGAVTLQKDFKDHTISQKAASLLEAERARQEKDDSALKGICESGTVKSLPSGKIAVCTEDAGWHLPTLNSTVKGDDDVVTSEQLDANRRAVLAEALLLDQGKTLSDSKGCLWFVWEGKGQLNVTRYLNVDDSQMCVNPETN